ncbi:isocitrate/isopropylmalate dehydrogenase family protein [Stygiobacter electus]|uniref:Isocitrate/isopropylmalate family dehydrogenase n=1 Tax=Stygiobacter electus TaxID=3032292 RepID=A0AAE3P2C7_9BACT|nr:isocitrate/isopropylmalate family dehydrogenase [Stygiobacter electus]MDF1611560.1 isocitrate/isopropylmalate family dehydrogenase [Stygiobacter electus]
MRTIVALPGDGIGKIVLPEAIRLLNAAGFKANYVYADIGWDFWCNEGNPLPQRTIDLIKEHKIALFGAITSKPNSEAQKELSPQLQNKGLVYFSPIVALRQIFNLDVCIRPCISFKGNPLNFIRKNINGSYDEPQINTVIFRQNTEGLYAGVEWTNPPKQVRDAFETHPRMKYFKDVPSEELAISTRIVTKKASEKIIRAAFEYARKFNYKNVTLCEKPNVLRETSGMMLKIAKEISKDYPEISLWDTNIDAQMMWLTKNPEDYGVIVAENMFGDIISDGFAGLIGGLGFACSANLGDKVAIFEPTHGSAPKYAELNPSIVNPIAMFLSSVMMLEHIGEFHIANKIRNAIAKVVEEGKVRSYDMLKLKGGKDVFEKGACSTEEMTNAVINNL